MAESKGDRRRKAKNLVRSRAALKGTGSVYKANHGERAEYAKDIAKARDSEAKTRREARARIRARAVASGNQGKTPPKPKNKAGQGTGKNRVLTPSEGGPKYTAAEGKSTNRSSTERRARDAQVRQSKSNPTNQKRMATKNQRAAKGREASFKRKTSNWTSKSASTGSMPKNTSTSYSVPKPKPKVSRGQSARRKSLVEANKKRSAERIAKNQAAKASRDLKRNPPKWTSKSQSPGKMPQNTSTSYTAPKGQQAPVKKDKPVATNKKPPKSNASQIAAKNRDTIHKGYQKNVARPLRQEKAKSFSERVKSKTPASRPGSKPPAEGDVNSKRRQNIRSGRKAERIPRSKEKTQLQKNEQARQDKQANKSAKERVQRTRTRGGPTGNASAKKTARASVPTPKQQKPRVRIPATVDKKPQAETVKPKQKPRVRINSSKVPHSPAKPSIPSSLKPSVSSTRTFGASAKGQAIKKAAAKIGSRAAMGASRGGPALAVVGALYGAAEVAGSFNQGSGRSTGGRTGRVQRQRSGTTQQPKAKGDLNKVDLGIDAKGVVDNALKNPKGRAFNVTTAGTGAKGGSTSTKVKTDNSKPKPQRPAFNEEKWRKDYRAKQAQRKADNLAKIKASRASTSSAPGSKYRYKNKDHVIGGAKALGNESRQHSWSNRSEVNSKLKDQANGKPSRRREWFARSVGYYGPLD